MPKSTLMSIQGAVEGPLDEVVLRRLVLHVHALPGAIYDKQGKQNLLQRLPSYNQAARSSPWAILIDLDQNADCAPPFVAANLPHLSPKMCCRVAVRSIEAWLLADRERLAHFLDVAIAKIPQNPETLADAKLTLIDVARHSRSQSVRQDIVPRPEGGRRVGPAYSSRLIEFVEDTQSGWRPEIAARRADSLGRCLRCLRRLTGRLI